MSVPNSPFEGNDSTDDFGDVTPLLVSDDFDADDADFDLSAYGVGDDDEDFGADASDFDMSDTNVIDMHAAPKRTKPDADDPDLTGELPGVALTEEHRALLIETRALTPEYLDSAHVDGTLRSFTSEDHVPHKRRFAVRKDMPCTGIWYGWRDPINPKGLIWQLRPDYPTKNAKGRANKYTFRAGVSTPVGLRSATRTFPTQGHDVILVEGTNQSLAVGSALHNHPQFVVVGFAGAFNAFRNGSLQPGIAQVIAGASKVYIAPDADAGTNRMVYDAMQRLAAAIRDREVPRNSVRFLHIPTGAIS